MSLQLSRPDVIVHPNAAEVKKMVARLALALVESAKQFVRWMDGTCLEAAPIPGAAPLPTHATLQSCGWHMLQGCLMDNKHLWACCVRCAVRCMRAGLLRREREGMPLAVHDRCWQCMLYGLRAARKPNL